MQTFDLNLCSIISAYSVCTAAKESRAYLYQCCDSMSLNVVPDTIRATRPQCLFLRFNQWSFPAWALPMSTHELCLRKEVVIDTKNKTPRGHGIDCRQALRKKAHIYVVINS